MSTFRTSRAFTRPCRYGVLDCTINPSGVEELAEQDDGWAVTLARVSRKTSSQNPHNRDGTSRILIVILNRLVWGLGGAFLGVYVIVQDLNIPLIIQPQIFGFLSLLAWAQVSTITIAYVSAYNAYSSVAAVTVHVL